MTYTNGGSGIYFVYFTDPHIQGTNYRSRKDYFPTTIFHKLDEVIATANNLDAPLICGGDLFNKYNVSIPIVRKLMNTLQTLKRKPMYMVLGNHDIYGHNPDAVTKVMVGLLEASGLVRLLYGAHDPVYFRDDKVEVQLTGVPYHIDMDSDRGIYYTEPAKVVKHKLHMIHVVHGYLVDKPWPKHNKYTLMEDVDTLADVVLTGHEHLGYGVKRSKGTVFCNPGALGRTSASLGEMNRVPKMAVIDISLNNIHIDLREICCALPSEQVLDRAKIEEEHARQQKFLDLQASLKEEVIALKLDDILEEVGKVKYVKKDVLAETKRRVALVQERMQEDW